MAKKNIIGIPSDISMYANQFSFFSRPLSRDLKDKVDIVLMGIPFDLGTTGRPGARYGPKSIRMASSNHCWEDIRWPWDFNTFDFINVIDYGDIDYIPGQPDSVVEAIQKNADNILSADKTLISIGGDHFVTLPLLRSHHQKYGKMALVHFDAHTDCVPNAQVINHASMFYHASNEGLIDPKHSIQIGIRTDYDRKSHEFQVIDTTAANDLSESEIIQLIQDRVDNLPVYLTFDIDCLDPAYAPGTGTPVVGGMTTEKALKVVRGLKNIKTIGFDLVEVSPQYDHAEITSLAGATIILEFLYIVGYQKRTNKMGNR